MSRFDCATRYRLHDHCGVGGRKTTDYGWWLQQEALWKGRQGFVDLLAAREAALDKAAQDECDEYDIGVIADEAEESLP